MINRDAVDFVCDSLVCHDDRDNPPEEFNDEALFTRIEHLSKTSQVSPVIVAFNNEYRISLYETIDCIIDSIFEHLSEKVGNYLDERLTHNDYRNNQKAITTGIKALTEKYPKTHFEYSTSSMRDGSVSDDIFELFLVMPADITDDEIITIDKDVQSVINRVWFNCLIDHHVDVMYEYGNHS